MKRLPMDSHVSRTVCAEIEAAQRLCRDRGAKIRVIRYPAEDFARIVGLLAQQCPFAPFAPTLCGCPVEPGTASVPETVTVRADAPCVALDTAGRETALIAGA